MTQPGGACLLPLPLPDGRVERSILFAVRRMAAGGVHDVNAAWLMLDLFSTGFRRPLVLLRTFMLELAHASQGPIRFAPCCAPRMTGDEGLILHVLRTSADDLPSAEEMLMLLTGNANVFEPLSAAAVFGRAVSEGPKLVA